MISVVIPTFNRISSLKMLLENLLKQTLDKGEYEIIIVDDGSTDETPEFMIKFMCMNDQIKYIRQENKGPAKARNLGVSYGRGEIIAFTDDDCLPDKNWLKVIRNRFSEDNNISGLEGFTYTLPEKVTPLTHQVVNYTGGAAYPTCNIAYCTKWLKKEGGFDEMFSHAHNEDVCLAWQMQNYGPIPFCVDMLVCHPPRPEKFLKLLKRTKIYGAEFYLYNKYPNKYRQTRTRNPWLNLFWRVPVVFRTRSVLSWLKHWHKPWFFFQYLALSISQYFFLLLLIPYFKKLDNESKMLINPQSNK